MQASEGAHRASPSIVVITEGGPHIWAIVNEITERIGQVTVLLEEAQSKSSLMRGRVRRLGVTKAAGQLGTMVLTRLGKRLFRARHDSIVAQAGLRTTPRAGQEIVAVPSANAPEVLAVIARLKPAVVFLAGCRMLSRQTLAAIRCPVLNYHPGIAPKYRGMNGGYWALASGDRENFGATVHLVDAGVDTGGVLRQLRAEPSPGDNLMLYPLRLAALSRDMCVAAIEDALAGRLTVTDTNLPSRQWYHPTLWSYLWTGIRRGVW